MRTFLVYMVVFIFGITDVFCQRDAVASGGQASGAGGNVSYSIGQIDYITASGSNGKLSEGVQQPYEIFVYTGIDEKNINLSVAVYPNPTIESIIISVKNISIQGVSYHLYDAQGKLVADKKLTEENTTILMSELPSAIYLIEVLKGNEKIKEFKIIKN